MKKITIPQSTYGKTAKYISSSTLRFTVTMDEQTYLKLLSPETPRETSIWPHSSIRLKQA